MSQILTNTADNSIILTINNTASSIPNVISMAPGESVLYDSVVIIDILNPNYNVDLIQSYIDSGVLIQETLTNNNISKLQILSQANLTIGLGTGVPKLIARSSNLVTDNLQVLPIMDKNNNISCVYYKSVQGMSFSTDLGTTQTLISNSNLLFPDEITSFAVQLYDSINGVLKVVNRLYIGTLREGIKTFTPNVDTTYINFDSDVYFPGAISGDKNPLFKNCVKTTVSGVPENIVSITFPEYCATYILGIINSPYNSGCPIFVASRPKYTEILDTIITVDNEYKTKVSFKYLNDSIYQSNVQKQIIHTSASTLPYIFTGPSYYENSSGWMLLQELGSVPESLSSIITFPNFQNDILDIITEYVPSGVLFITKDNIGNNNLYQIFCHENIMAIPPDTAYPKITEIVFPLDLQTGKIKNISYLLENDLTNYDYFITTDKEVWRYSSISNTWVKFIYSGVASQRLNGTIDNQYLDTSINNGILTWNGTTYLKELSNFALIPKIGSDTEYIGLLGTELGLFFYNLVLSNNIFTTPYKNGRTLLSNVAQYPISDLKIVDSYAFTCSFNSQIPRTYFNNVNCLRLINTTSALDKQVFYLKPDIEFSNSLYYITDTSLYENSVFSGEQKSYNPVLLDTTYVYNLTSPTYSFKLDNLYQYKDNTLILSLCSFLAYKYYFPTITERIISSVNKLEPQILQLNDFKHSFRINNINSITLGNVGTSTTILNQSIVSLPIFINNNHTKNSIICIRSDGKTILPTIIKQTKTKRYISIASERNVGETDDEYYIRIGYTFDQYNTVLTFSEVFSGTVFVQSLNISDQKILNFSGLFSTISHMMNKYPQIVINGTFINDTADTKYPKSILNGSAVSNLNDIRYIDSDRLEFSFTSSTNTTLTLL